MKTKQGRHTIIHRRVGAPPGVVSDPGLEALP